MMVIRFLSAFCAPSLSSLLIGLILIAVLDGKIDLKLSFASIFIFRGGGGVAGRLGRKLYLYSKRLFYNFCFL